jgi:serine/threonine protein kinase SCH9
LIVRLLDKNQKSRLKIGQVKTHKFFENFDFINLYRLKLTPPFVPELKSEEDYKYIDPGLEKEKAEDSQVNDLCVQMAKGKKIILICILYLIHK